MNKSAALETWLQLEEWYTLEKQALVMCSELKWSRVRSVDEHLFARLHKVGGFRARLCNH